MSLAEHINATLLADAAIVAAVGTRVRRNSAPQGEDLPFIVFSRLSVTPLRTLRGPTGREQSLWAVVAVALDGATADAIGQAVRNALDPAPSGLNVSAWVPATERVAHQATEDGTIEPEAANEQTLQVSTVTFAVWAEEE